MFVLINKYKISLFLIIIFCFQCGGNISNNSSEENDPEISVNIVPQKSKLGNKLNTCEAGQYKGKTVVFFSLNKNEYDIFINRMGKNTKWEFDIIYNNFKKTAKNAKEPLKNININSGYTTEKIIAFITSDNDTLNFNRDNEDYFVGQIFFDGNDSLYIVEGLFKADNLEEKIIDFFDIKKDFNISAVAQMSDSFRYFTPDTNVVLVQDTLSQ